jgi:N-acyl-L-homoserine lactone synthetase
MIVIVDGINASEHRELLDQMHRLRARVFSDRLGWQVNVRDGREVDEFDSLCPTHVICVADDGAVVGSMRLLQTTGPHMLADVFAPLLDGEPPPRSSRLWEATRFCVDIHRLPDRRGPRSVSSVTSEVMIGAFEYGMEAGITDAIAVIDPIMHRVMIRSGNGPSGYVGTPKSFGKATALAVLMDCSAERVRRLRQYAGITHDVFAPSPGAVATPGSLMVA